MGTGRQGRTHIHNHRPAHRLYVEGEGMGSSIHLQPGGMLNVRAEACSVSPFHVLQIVLNGEVVAEERVEREHCGHRGLLM